MRRLMVLLTLAAAVAVHGAQASNQPVEVGSVDWGRDLDAALEHSAASGKPVLVLFQDLAGGR